MKGKSVELKRWDRVGKKERRMDICWLSKRRAEECGAVTVRFYPPPLMGACQLSLLSHHKCRQESECQILSRS